MDLSLSPYTHHPSQWNWHLEVARLPLDRDYRLFSQVSKDVMGDREKVKQVCKPKPLPPNVNFDKFEDEGIKTRRTDPYGEGLTYVEAWELAKVSLDKDASPWNVAVFAMMKQLPENIPVILWWH